MKEAVKFILKRKYNKHKIYVHNFSQFDGIFLLKIISEVVEVSNIKPIIRDNKIISLNLKYSNKYYVEFRDSYLLLTSSLEKLGKTFALNKGKYENKLPFPYKFVNDPNINYNYIGETPGLNYFENINSYKIFLDNLDIEKWGK
jgi:DNA polymerase type B, organellar and viral